MRRIFGAAILAATTQGAAAPGDVSRVSLSPAFWSWALGIHALYDPVRQSTRVQARLETGECLSFRVPLAWAIVEPGLHEATLRMEGGVEIGLEVKRAKGRAADLASGEALRLQRAYEALLGSPAQSVSLDPIGAGAARFTATWIDASLPTPSRSLTLETYLFPMETGLVLELTPSNLGERATREALAREIAASAKASRGC